MGHPHLYHLADKGQWEACKASQAAYYPPTYDQDGFIHLTADPGLLLDVANQFYKDAPGDWLVLKLDSAKLTAEVKYEPAAPVGNTPPGSLSEGKQGEEPLFPHLYGTIDFAAVVEELPAARNADGTFVSIEGVRINAIMAELI